ncbi:MAG TPA: hypothetical protein VEF76_07905 [Patescibacteria group bacterium]|nr:hypothetical protein [Patescibacteria group bacterium]
MDEDWKRWLEDLPEKLEKFPRKNPLDWESFTSRKSDEAFGRGYEIRNHDEINPIFSKDISSLFDDAASKFVFEKKSALEWALPPDFKLKLKTRLLSSAFAVAQEMGKGTATQLAAPPTARFSRPGII